MIYNKSIGVALCITIALPMTIAVGTGCKKNKDGMKQPDAAANFIPPENKKLIYNIESEGESQGTATVFITGTKDSTGITVYTERSVIEDTAGRMIVLDNKRFDLKGKTYTEIKVPEAWYTTVALFGSMPDIRITKTEVFGYPAYIMMENALKNGSVISTDGALIQGQRIEYTNKGEAGLMQQEIVQSSGTAVVETIQVPAGSFTCNKFSYEVLTKITNRLGSSEYTGNGEEKITIWMAHGIGMVQQESTSKLITLVPLPTGEIKEVATYTKSLTTLQKIN